MAPQVGLEPTTTRLTAECSTIELLRKKIRRRSTLPGRYQPSTLDAKRLNCCVRNGNRWDPLAIVTGNGMRFKRSRGKRGEYGESVEDMGSRWGSAPNPAGGSGVPIMSRTAVRSVWKPTCAIFDSSTGGKWLRSPRPPPGDDPLDPAWGGVRLFSCKLLPGAARRLRIKPYAPCCSACQREGIRCHHVSYTPQANKPHHTLKTTQRATSQ